MSEWLESFPTLIRSVVGQVRQSRTFLVPLFCPHMRSEAAKIIDLARFKDTVTTGLSLQVSYRD